MNFVNTGDMSWDTLPHIVLSKVFKHLDEKDRLNASLVSKSWSEAFRSPELWRIMEFEFPKLPAIFGENPSKFVNSGLSEYVVELEIDCYRGIGKRTSRESLHNLLGFLFNLTQRQLSLCKFSFTDVKFESACWKEIWRRRKAENLIRKFLVTQSNMKQFNMNFCQASPKVGIDFLSQLAKKNSRSLNNMQLVDFFNSTCNVLSYPGYHNVMDSFKNLVELLINYSYLDANVLTTMSENCHRSLKVIEIFCEEDDQMDHVIPNDTWTLVRKLCPQLEVLIDITDLYFFSDYSHIIPSKMGLHGFDVSIHPAAAATQAATDPRVVGLDDLAKQLYKFHRKTLVRIFLDFKKSRFDERLLIELISSCHKLETFYFAGVVSIEMVKKLYEMQIKGDIHLKKCNFSIRNDDDDDTLILSIKKIFEQNKSAFEEQGVKFICNRYDSDDDED